MTAPSERRAQAPRAVADIGRPVPGIYRLRLSKGAPWSAVRIWDEAERCPETGELMEDERFRCLVNGRDVNPDHYAERVNCFGERIDDREYAYLLSVNGWAVEHAPETPEASPTERVDLHKSPPIF